MPGILMSRKTRSGASRSASAMPSGPLERLDDLVVVVAQDHPDRAADLGLVIDDENACFHRIWFSRLSRRRPSRASAGRRSDRSSRSRGRRRACAAATIALVVGDGRRRLAVDLEDDEAAAQHLARGAGRDRRATRSRPGRCRGSPGGRRTRRSSSRTRHAERHLRVDRAAPAERAPVEPVGPVPSSPLRRPLGQLDAHRLPPPFADDLEPGHASPAAAPRCPGSAPRWTSRAGPRPRR